MPAVDPLASATDLVAALRERQISSRELLAIYLDRIDRLNPALNAVVTIDADRGMAEAKAADDSEPVGPLHGLPMTIKDSIETAGMRTTVGAPEFSSHVPAEDAVAVARLRRAGAVIFGKTNLPAWAGDCQSYNDVFGTTNNPWDHARTPGGSSGGAAAATAAGLTALELGSDLGGSIRIPVHFCGVYGLKPTWDIVPTRGHIPPPPGILSELDTAVVGPIARSAADLDLALGVLAGPNEARATAWQLNIPPPRAGALADYRIAMQLDDPYCSIDATILELQHAVVEALVAAGASITDASGSAPNLAEGHDVAQRLIQGAMSAAIPDDEYDRLVERASVAAPDDDSPPVRWARNITQRARDLNIVVERRAHLVDQWRRFFADHDILLYPVMPTPAFPHDHTDTDARTITVNGASRSYADQFAWLQAIGVAHLPVVTAPIGLTPGGLPVGIQIVAPHLEDRTAIDFARRLGEVIGGYQPPPGA